MKRNRLRLVLLSRWIASVILFISLYQAASQQQRLPLKSVLDTLENRYEVVFSYADELVAGKTTFLPERGLSLDSCLQTLSIYTGLLFDQLDDRYIAIRSQSSGIFCGYLIDKDNGEPIQYAFISLSGKSGYQTSNEDGFFRFPDADISDKVAINHLSYVDTLLGVYHGQCDTIFLKSRISELGAVYVSNYLVKGLNKKSFGEFEVQPRSLQVLPGLSEPDVLYTLQVLPGIQSPSESVADINIRGGNNDQNLMLWDGIRMFQSGHFYGLISAFNPYFTEQVTLTRNGSSAIYGESVSGILNMQSTTDIEKEFSGGAGINWLSGDIYFNLPVSSKVSLSVAARRSIADLIRTPTYNKYYKRAFVNTDVGSSSSNKDEQFRFYDLSAKLNVELSQSDKINLSFISISNDLMYGEEEVINGIAEEKTSSLTQQTMGLGLMYSRHWNDKLTSKLNAYASSYQLAATNNDISNNQRLIQENDVLDVGLQFDLEVKFNDFISWKNGLQYEETGITNLEDLNNPVFRRSIKNVMTRYVAYSELSMFSARAKTNLRFGIRANYFDQLSKFIPEPRLIFRQELTPSLSFELMGEFKSQTTSQIIDLQSDFLGVEKRRWVLANDGDIPVARGKQISGGLLYQKNRLLISGEIYYKVVDGMITSGQGFQNQFELIRSSGSYETYGGEFLISKQFDHFSSWGSYNLSWNRYSFQDLYSSPFPNNLDIRHNLSIGTSLTLDHFEFSSGINWHSGIPYTPVNTGTPIIDNEIQYGAPNSGRLKSYFRLDLSSKYLFKLWDQFDSQIGFSLWNLTNYQNIIRSFFVVDGEGNVAQIKQKGLTFTPNVFLRVNF